MEITKKNVVLNFGNTVHIGFYSEKGFQGVSCGAEFTRSQFSRKAHASETTHEVTCKRCMKRAEKRAQLETV